MFIICNLHEKMKRKISILLSFILLISSSGFTLNKHYCNGELVNIFLLPHFGKCCDSNMPMDDDSCEDEFVGFFSDGPIELIAPKIVLKHSVQWMHLPKNILLIVDHCLDLKTRKVAFVPPPVNNIKIYLRVEAFLN